MDYKVGHKKHQSFSPKLSKLKRKKIKNFGQKSETVEEYNSTNSQVSIPINNCDHIDTFIDGSVF